jgi:hypothetical protein
VISYAVVIECAADGGYGAWCPDLPGCVALADVTNTRIPGPLVSVDRQAKPWQRWRERAQRVAGLRLGVRVLPSAPMDCQVTDSSLTLYPR